VAREKPVWCRPFQVTRPYVRLAIDVAAKALAGEFDVAIIASCDTDIAPAVDMLLDLKATKGTPDIELISLEGFQSKVGVPRARLVYREIAKSDFDAVSDPVDYNVRVLETRPGSLGAGGCVQRELVVALGRAPFLPGSTESSGWIFSQ